MASRHGPGPRGRGRCAGVGRPRPAPGLLLLASGLRERRARPPSARPGRRRRNDPGQVNCVVARAGSPVRCRRGRRPAGRLASRCPRRSSCVSASMFGDEPAHLEQHCWRRESQSEGRTDEACDAMEGLVFPASRSAVLVYATRCGGLGPHILRALSPLPDRRFSSSGRRCHQHPRQHLTPALPRSSGAEPSPASGSWARRRCRPASHPGLPINSRMRRSRRQLVLDLADDPVVLAVGAAPLPVGCSN